MKPIYMDIVKHNMLLTSELIKIMKLLEENDIKAIAFKGPTLAQLAYGDITLRQYVDLDVLVHIDNIDKTILLFNNNNYLNTLNLTNYEIDFRKKNFHEISFHNKSNNIAVEIHWNLVDNDHPFDLKRVKYFEDFTFLKLQNYDLNIFQNEKLLLYLCIHGSSHFYERIEWIVDIDRLIRRNYIDWIKFEELILKSDEISRSVYLGLYISFLLFKTPFTMDINMKIKNRLNEEIANLILLNFEKSNLSIINKIIIELKLLVSVNAKIKYIHKMIFKPTLNEIKIIELNKKYYFVYYFIRFYNVFKNIFKT